MCNGSLYNYKEFESYHIFGAMIMPESGNEAEIAQKLTDKGFAVQIVTGTDSEMDNNET